MATLVVIVAHNEKKMESCALDFLIPKNYYA
jgi:hypothetical protein